MSRQRTPFFGPSDMHLAYPSVTGTTVVGPGAPRSEVFQEMHRVLKPGGGRMLPGTAGTGWDRVGLQKAEKVLPSCPSATAVSSPRHGPNLLQFSGSFTWLWL